MKFLIVTATLIGQLASAQGEAVNYDDPNMAQTNAYVTDSARESVASNTELMEAVYAVRTTSYDSDSIYGTAALIHPDGRMPASDEASTDPTSVK